MARLSFYLLSSLLLGAASFSLATPTNTSKPFTHPEPRVNWDSTCKCGQKSSGRIVGGAETGVNEWRWQVALLVNGQQFCGGSLINDRYVLSAAHCFTDLTASRVTVRLSEHDLDSTSETTVVDRSVSQIISHASYDSDSQENDIALLKLSSPVEVGSTVLPVCLPPPNPTYAKKTATVTGWGTLTSGGLSADKLREVQVPVLSNADCENTGYGNAIVSTMMCAGQAGKDSCQGDSGGPLVFQDGGGNYDQIGVVSWGYGCGANDYPGVYTRVNSYLDWIKTNTADGIYCKGMKL